MIWIIPAILLCTEVKALTYADATAPVRVQSFACEIIREYVARYGMAAAEKWARTNKWSKTRIAEAKECLR